jgi:hypothetical protein
LHIVGRLVSGVALGDRRKLGIAYGKEKLFFLQVGKIDAESFTL